MVSLFINYMKLCTTIESEKGKEIKKTANEYIFQQFTVNKIPVGEIELYYFDDSKDDPENCKEGEWLIKYRPVLEGQEEEDKADWNIIAQGNI